LEVIAFASALTAAAGFLLAARALAIAAQCVYVKTSPQIRFPIPPFHGADYIDPSASS
jgi:hypothetical protein